MRGPNIIRNIQQRNELKQLFANDSNVKVTTAMLNEVTNGLEEGENAEEIRICRTAD